MNGDANPIGIDARRLVHSLHLGDWCRGFEAGSLGHGGNCGNETEVAGSAIREIENMVKASPADALELAREIIAALGGAGSSSDISPRRFVHDRHGRHGDGDWCDGGSYHHSQCDDETDVAEAAMLAAAREIAKGGAL
jgi:hypothetical protein